MSGEWRVESGEWRVRSGKCKRKGSRFRREPTFFSIILGIGTLHSPLTTLH